MYGFHKINRTPRNQRPQPDAQRWEFSHPKFLRGRTDLLEDIKRKATEPDPYQTTRCVELPTELAAQPRPRMSPEHKEVVEALIAERRKVDKLVGVVQNLFETNAHITGDTPKSPSQTASVDSHSLDLLAPAFPVDLLESPSPPAYSSPLLDGIHASLNHSSSHPIKLTRNTLVPAGQSSTSSSRAALTSCLGRGHPSRTTRGTAVAVEQQKVDEYGHGNKRLRLGVELAGPGEVRLRRASTGSQTQPDGRGLSPPETNRHAK